MAATGIREVEERLILNRKSKQILIGVGAAVIALGLGLVIWLINDRPERPAAEPASAVHSASPEVMAEAPTQTPIQAEPTSRPATSTPTALPDPGQAGPPNRLINEKSPYLLQHAYNPVDWYPWGAEAFEKARQENKPIFLSIGYSTCHWCHVMAEESFEDPEVARLLNETFVSIKVDREERPDIDNIYMNVAVMMTGSGGWPLNIMLTPDQKPFFAATYIPRENRFGRLGMLELIPQVQTAWATEQSNLLDIADEVAATLQQIRPEAPGEALDETVLAAAFQELAGRFDPNRGGFDAAPKFPAPHNLLFLLRYWRRTGDEQALDMVETTLQAIRRGGIYDQVGFGVHRYSTDADWLVPHFEKMLYDQALLAIAYTEAFQATGKPEYRQTAQELFSYVLRDMTGPAGGFYGAEDADSDGEEGKFYLWTEAELRQILSPEEADMIVTLFNVSPAGNFREAAGGQTNGANILHMTQAPPEVAANLGMSAEEFDATLEAARQKLFTARQARIPPHRDDKILTDWNGLMIAALAKGGRVLGEPAYAEAAGQAADFILENVRNDQGRLLHRYRDGEASTLANIDDYAFLIWGLLELYETNFEIQYLESALNLTDEMVTHFWDEESGGFYFTPDDGEELLVRRKEIYDGAIPAGNSVAMSDLLRLGRLTANPDLEEKAAEIGRAFAGNIRQSPASFAQLMTGVDFGVGPAYEVVIVGQPGSEDTQAMLTALRAKFVPNKVVLLRPPENPAQITRLAEYTKYHSSLNGRATAYVCLNYYCQLPTNDVETMLALLDKS